MLWDYALKPIHRKMNASALKLVKVPTHRVRVNAEAVLSLSLPNALRRVPWPFCTIPPLGPASSTPLLFMLLIFSISTLFLHRHDCHRRRREEEDHEMVGLSVLLEGYSDFSEKRTPQVISKASMIKPSPTSPTSTSPNPFSERKACNLSAFPTMTETGFLDRCFLCKQKLLPSKDIFMYKGDRAFCSEECRCRHIFIDEEENLKAKTEHCSLAAIKAQPTRSSASSSRGRRGPRN